MDRFDQERLDRAAKVLPALDPATIAKHRARAVDIIASHRCATDLTDGFCGPRDGTCPNGGRRNCIVQAEGILRMMESRGLVAVWVYDRVFGALPGDGPPVVLPAPSGSEARIP